MKQICETDNFYHIICDLNYDQLLKEWKNKEILKTGCYFGFELKSLLESESKKL
ncbi:MAG: hypothetical protein Q8781_01985 [Candidatus Phytoplasma stylosanthis]|uniref:hypothetical protein n=1 Tax=Candidatus Phytoplasma stylosanthis TaxID=2798314 RepID=UPI00293B78D9|nr:hypothetical protein [Candidatus Phytoplasma stylosanthis]MDV3167964.1 hypothetical protein [Candidatus Phytoplasma stylosanthis]MDV3171055.1 hypothetical protein [Candidatus Phytoplasma stylosanthis]MDV3173656.1 hypothetical protein [Candidatus Phytoplasma stylosanthis]MDV3174223.1 hypothetical protein [Candidatus Phytoplasma stylosanthis]MDV3202720.1 hypothetical protein [Candidatus Phytoplasma stylosanthis]